MNLNSNNFLISKLNLNRTRKDKLVHSFIPKKHCLPFSFLFFFYASNHSFQYESKSSSPFNYSPHPVKLNCTVYFLNFHPDRHFIKLFVPRHLFACPLPHSNSHTKIIEKFRAKNEAVHRRRSRTMDRTFTFFFFFPLRFIICLTDLFANQYYERSASTSLVNVENIFSPGSSIDRYWKKK